MAIHDHIKPGLDARVMAKIVTVDPSQRKIEAALKDGGLIHIAVFDSSSVFVWPQQGEHWTVRKDSGIWRLDRRVDSNDEHKIDNINPGEAKIYADTITNMSGHIIPAVDTTSNKLAENAVLVYQGNSWVPITGPKFESITVKKDDKNYVEIKSTADIHVLNGAITIKSDDSNFINARATGDLSLLNGSILISGSETISYTPKIIDKIESNTPINDPPRYVTYTCYGHGLTAGQVVSILDADVAGFNGSFVVVAVTDSTFRVENRTVGDSSSARIVYVSDDYTQITTGDITTTTSVHTSLVHTTNLLVDNTATVGGSSSNTSIDTNGNTEVGGYLWSAGDFYLGATRNSGTSKVYMDSATGNSTFRGNITATGTVAGANVNSTNLAHVGALLSDGDIASGNAGRLIVKGSAYASVADTSNPTSDEQLIDRKTLRGYEYATAANLNDTVNTYIPLSGWKQIRVKDPNNGNYWDRYSRTYTVTSSGNFGVYGSSSSFYETPDIAVPLSTSSTNYFFNIYWNYTKNSAGQYASGLSTSVTSSIEPTNTNTVKVYLANQSNWVFSGSFDILIWTEKYSF
jgi:hypothetical protein